MPRIPLITEAAMTPAQRQVYDAMVNGPRKSAPVGPLAIAMHRPELAQAMSGLGLVLRRRHARPGFRTRRSKRYGMAGRGSRRGTNRRSTITGWNC